MISQQARQDDARAPLGAGAGQQPRLLRLPWRNGSARRMFSFALVGGCCTVAFAILYNWFRSFAIPIEANIAAMSLTMVANFVANRWLTFRAHPGSLFSHAMGYGIAYLAGLTASSALLQLGLLLAPHPSVALETLLAIASGGVATVLRFVLLSTWVFRPVPVHPVQPGGDGAKAEEGAARAA